MSSDRRPLTIEYTPKNPRQIEVREAWADTRLMFLLGEAGTGKTTAALAEALQDVFKQKAQKVYLARPMIAVDEEYGFLTGDLAEKTAPWMSAFEDVLGGISEVTLQSLKRYIEIVPIGMLRGRTIRHGTLIVDEAQNCSWNQLVMLGSRVGPGGRLVLSGDPYQTDVPAYRCDSPLEKCALRLSKMAGVTRVVFQKCDQLRDPFVTEFLNRMQ